MYAFSPITLEQLAAAGWTQERYFDTTDYEHLLRKEGYPVLSVAMQFLSSFVACMFCVRVGAFVAAWNPFIFRLKRCSVIRSNPV